MVIEHVDTTTSPDADTRSVPVSGDESWGRETAAQLLGATSVRYAHTCRVARQAGSVRHLIPDPWRSVLVEAAWLHDIGYSKELVQTGFHPIDGARWLRSRDRSAEVCSLVAWHTRALTEARLRGLEDALIAEFVAPPAAAQAMLTWADLTSSPSGQRWEPEIRISEILSRYGPTSIVHQATRANEMQLLADARSVAQRFGDLDLPGDAP